MNQALEVAVRKKGEVVLIDIKGDVTAVTGEHIEQAYQQACSEGTSKVLLCFDGGGYINSGGIAIIIGIAADGKETERVIRITGLSPHFQKIFGMVGLTKYAEIFPSEQAALAQF
ncbi:MAG: STAS domain-containing protein [Deltaproteobacteria bacterium]|nr:STAS domain-containing protein [Deltaproteobacteria bacterium]